MKKVYVILSVLLMSILLCVGVVSVADADLPSGDGKLTEMLYQSEFLLQVFFPKSRKKPHKHKNSLN